MALILDGTAGITTPAISNSGNLTFTGTGNRITGDFSNATFANRVSFQSSTTNGQTEVSLIPNGTNANARSFYFSSSDTANASVLNVGVTGPEATLRATITGSGTYPTMTFYTGGSERMRIDTSGNLGLGVTPSAWTANARFMQVPYGAFGTSASGYPQIMNNAYEYSADAYKYTNSGLGACRYLQGFGQHQWFTAPSGTAGNAISFTQAMTLDASGNLLVGTTSGAGSNRFYCPTMYSVTTASAANMVVDANGLPQRSTSALKYKQNIRDLETIDIGKFRPVRYNSKCEGDDQTIDFFGIVADEVDAAGIKELVTYGADGEVEGFQYERLTVVLLKAIQELKAEIDELKAKVN